MVPKGTFPLRVPSGPNKKTEAATQWFTAPAAVWLTVG